MQLLERSGLDGFTTNRLAVVSGFSIGTIYQYFDDKRAILSALAWQEYRRAILEVRRLLAAEVSNTPAEATGARPRATVRALLLILGGQHRAQRLLLRMAIQGVDCEPLGGAEMAELAALLVSSGGAPRAGVSATLSETDAYVLSQAILGPITGALLNNSRLLRKAQFENSLVDLVDAFIQRRVGEVKQ
jgi:AcrR family transcriptional regulator